MTEYRKPFSNLPFGQRFEDAYFQSGIIDNNLRGYVAELLLLEALGQRAQLVSHGWHAWDIDLGNREDSYPNYLRIQVKNSAKVQTWSEVERNLEDAAGKFQLRLSKPDHLRVDLETPNDRCQAVRDAFSCDLFTLMFHTESDRDKCDQRDPSQWVVYLVPTSPNCGAITAEELDDLVKRSSNGQLRPSTERSTNSLANGIRGRLPIAPIPLTELTAKTCFDAVQPSDFHS